MLRLSGLYLPLDHPPEALPKAIATRLGIAPDELRSHFVYRRGNDARRRNAIQLVYAVDVELADEAAVLARFPGDKEDRKSTRLNSSHVKISYAVFCLKKKKKYNQ